MKKQLYLCAFFLAQVFIMNVHLSEAQEIKAKAYMMDRDGKSAGTVTFTQADKGVKVDISINGLPAGKHAFHIHENGVCDAPDFTTSGGHFNPYNAQHGFLNPQGPHVGDLPNIKVKEDGTYACTFTSALFTLNKEKPNSLLKEGKTAVVIHENLDDYLTDPAGMGGTRIACGVIEETNP